MPMEETGIGAMTASGRLASEQDKKQLFTDAAPHISTLPVNGCSDDHLEFKLDVSCGLERGIAKDGSNNDFGYFDIHYTVGRRWLDHVQLSFDNPDEFDAFAAIVAADAARARKLFKEWNAAKPADWLDDESKKS